MLVREHVRAKETKDERERVLCCQRLTTKANTRSQEAQVTRTSVAIGGRGSIDPPSVELLSAADSASAPR